MTDFFFNQLGCGHPHPEERNGTGLWLAARGVSIFPITFNKWLPSIEAKSSLQALGPLSLTHLRGQSMDKLGQMLAYYTPGPQTCPQ